MTVALGRWDVAYGDIPVGGAPGLIVFDGTSMWVVVEDVQTSGNWWLTRFRTSDGSTLATYTRDGLGEVAGMPPLAPVPSALGFDGSYVWVGTGDKLLFIRASDGQVAEKACGLPAPITAFAFDGSEMWVAHSSQLDIYVAPLCGSRGGPGLPAISLMFDGSAFYAGTDRGDPEALSRFGPTSSGTVRCPAAYMRDYPPPGREGLSFDGHDIWTLYKDDFLPPRWWAVVVRPPFVQGGPGDVSAASCQAYRLGTSPGVIASQGSYIWAASGVPVGTGPATVSKLYRFDSGADTLTASTSQAPGLVKGMAFDGTRMWFSDWTNGKLLRR
jgi:hypothetical protein